MQNFFLVNTIKKSWYIKAMVSRVALFFSTFLFCTQAWALTASDVQRLTQPLLEHIEQRETNDLQLIEQDQSIPAWKKRIESQKLREQWSQHRNHVLQQVQQFSQQLKSYEEQRIDSAVRIQVRLRQAVDEIERWRESQLSFISTSPNMNAAQKQNMRMQVHKQSDERITQLHLSAQQQKQRVAALHTEVHAFFKRWQVPSISHSAMRTRL